MLAHLLPVLQVLVWSQYGFWVRSCSWIVNMYWISSRGFSVIGGMVGVAMTKRLEVFVVQLLVQQLQWRTAPYHMAMMPCMFGTCLHVLRAKFGTVPNSGGCTASWQRCQRSSTDQFRSVKRSRVQHKLLPPDTLMLAVPRPSSMASCFNAQSAGIGCRIL